MRDSIGERIKKSRIAKSLTQDDVAKLMDVTRGAVANWEHNRSLPPAKNFPRLAQILGVSASYLQMESDYPIANEIPLPEDLLKIPIIATVKCGVNGLAFEEDGGYINVEKKHGEDLRAFRCKGDSMINEGIHDGDIAIVRIQDQVESGELAIVVINGDEGTLKKVRYQGESIILESANPAYPARVFTGVDREGNCPRCRKSHRNEEEMVMKKIFALLLTLLVLCAGCGGDGKKLDVKNAEPPKQAEIKNPKIESIQDAKLKMIAKEISVNLKKNDAIAGFNKIKFAKNGLGEKDFSTTNVIVELQCDKSKSLTRKKVFDAIAVAFKSIYKDPQIKNASITLVDADNDNICTLELDRETEKQITWEQADKMKDWNKIAELFVEYPKMRKL